MCPWWDQYIWIQACNWAKSFEWNLCSRGTIHSKFAICTRRSGSRMILSCMIKHVHNKSQERKSKTNSPINLKRKNESWPEQKPIQTIVGFGFVNLAGRQVIMMMESPLELQCAIRQDRAPVSHRSISLQLAQNDVDPSIFRRCYAAKQNTFKNLEQWNRNNINCLIFTWSEATHSNCRLSLSAFDSNFRSGIQIFFRLQERNKKFLERWNKWERKRKQNWNKILWPIFGTWHGGIETSRNEGSSSCSRRTTSTHWSQRSSKVGGWKKYWKKLFFSHFKRSSWCYSGPHAIKVDNRFKQTVMELSFIL